MARTTRQRLPLALLALTFAATGAAPQPAEATRYLYASGLVSTGVAAFAIAPDATLRPVSGSPFASQSGGLAVGVAPDATLRPVPASPFASHSGGLAVGVTPDGRHVYAPGLATANLSAFAVRPDGGLAPVDGSPFSTGAPAGALAFAPDGRHLYLTTAADGGTILGFTIRPDGVLDRLPDAPTHAGGMGAVASLAITPDGRHLYAASYIGGTIKTYDVLTDGRLSPAPGTPTASGQGSVWPSITPDGRHLYVSNEKDNNISAYSIRTDGGLITVPGSPFAVGNVPHPTQVTPDGRFLYVPNVFSNTISAFEIAANGVLTPLPGAPYPGGQAGTFPGSIAIAPDGRHAYITEIGTLAPTGIPTSHVHVYAIAPKGALNPMAAAPITTGLVFSDGASSTITPNQGPTAAFSVRRRGRRETFDARASRDPDGSIARYDWSFGDGTTRPDGGPTPTHTYRRRGPHRATLTVTDNEGCSTQRIYTGQTALCIGGSAARKSRSVR